MSSFMKIYVTNSTEKKYIKKFTSTKKKKKKS